MLGLHVPMIIAYLIERFVFFLDPSFFLTQSIQETSIREGFMEIFSCLLDTLPLHVSYSLLIKLLLLSKIFMNSFM